MRRRRVTGLDVAVLGTLGALFMLVRILDVPGPERFDSYPEPVAALLAEVTSKVPVDGDVASSFGALSQSMGRIQSAVEALGPYRAAAVEPLMTLVESHPATLYRDQTGLNRARAMFTLSAIGADAAGVTPRLLAIVADPSEHVALRRTALETVVKIGDIPLDDVPIVLSVLRNTADAEFRKSAIDAVAIIGPPASAGLSDVVAALHEEKALMRIAAAEAIAAIGPAARSAIPALATALGDPRPLVRTSVARSLESFGPAAEPAIGALIGLLSTDQPMEPVIDDSMLEGELGSLIDQAIEDQGMDPAVLRRVLAAEHGTDGLNWVRVAAADALASIGPAAADAIPALIIASHDLDDSVRDAASKALIAIRGR